MGGGGDGALRRCRSRWCCGRVPVALKQCTRAQMYWGFDLGLRHDPHGSSCRPRCDVQRAARSRQHPDRVDPALRKSCESYPLPLSENPTSPAWALLEPANPVEDRAIPTVAPEMLPCAKLRVIRHHGCAHRRIDVLRTKPVCQSRGCQELAQRSIRARSTSRRRVAPGPHPGSRAPLPPSTRNR